FQEHTECTCELNNSERIFPHEKLRKVESSTSDCKSNIIPQKVSYPVSHSVILFVCLTTAVPAVCGAEESTLEIMKTEMKVLEKFDTMQVIKGRQTIEVLRVETSIGPARVTVNTHFNFPSGTCPRSRLVSVTGPVFYTEGEYPGLYSYGSWGCDPKPEKGKENCFPVTQLLLLSLLFLTGNVYIHTSNPTTNTIQGPNNVLYGGALYYNCYNRDAVCRFNLTTKHVTTLELHQGTRFFSTTLFLNESGVWVVFTTSLDFGNMILSKVEEGEPPALGKTWQTSVYKQAVTNTFMACGVLYATRYVNQELEEIFYSFNTVTGKERFNLGIFISKISPNIQALNYSPVDQTLHVYSDSNMVSYKVIFEAEKP
uniref:Olfactomedin-4 n=1 Tax=Oreochromis niloticus TaxID=8128 RepID=A0A669D4Z6_ORENI